MGGRGRGLRQALLRAGECLGSYSRACASQNEFAYLAHPPHGVSAVTAPIHRHSGECLRPTLESAATPWQLSSIHSENWRAHLNSTLTVQPGSRACVSPAASTTRERLPNATVFLQPEPSHLGLSLHFHSSCHAPSPIASALNEGAFGRGQRGGSPKSFQTDASSNSIPNGEDQEAAGSDEDPTLSSSLLEMMLKEMESTFVLEGGSVQPGLVEKGDDQFVASLRLRLAQAYLAEGKETDKIESQAQTAWQYFRAHAEADDPVAALCLQILGTCRGRRGDVEGALLLLSKALSVCRRCRQKTHPARVGGLKLKGPKEGRRGAAASAQSDDRGAAAAAGAAEQAGGIRGQVAHLEYTCHMSMGELRQSIAQHQDAQKHFLSALKLADTGALRNAPSAAQDALLCLAELNHEMGDYEAALQWAARGKLGLPRPVPAQGPPGDPEPGLSGASPAQGRPGAATDGAAGEGAEAERFVQAVQMVQENRLMAAIHMGLNAPFLAAQHMEVVSDCLCLLDAPALEIASAQVSAAEAFLSGLSDDPLVLSTSKMDETLLADMGREGELEGRTEGKEVGEGKGKEGSEEGEEERVAVEGGREGSMGEGQEKEVDEALLAQRALDLLLAAEWAQREELGETHPILASTYVAGAMAGLRLGDEATAQRMCDAAVAVFEHWSAAQSAEAVAEAALGPAAKEAVAEVREAVEGDEEGGLGAPEPELLAQAATVCVMLRRTEDGLRLIRQAEEGLASFRMDDALRMYVEFCSTLLSVGDYETARLEAEQALQLHNRASTRHPQIAAELLHAKACALSAVSRQEDSLKVLREAKAELDKEDGAAESEAGLQVLSSLVVCLCTLERWTEAALEQEKVLDMLTKALGDEHPFVLTEKAKLVEISGIAHSQ